MNDVRVFIAASLGAVAAYLLVQAAVPRRARVMVRVEPFVGRHRARLGTVVPERPKESRSVWGPMATAVAGALARLVDAASESSTEIVLRQAGMSSMTVEAYRRRQLLFTVAGFGGGVGLASLLRLQLFAAVSVTCAATLFGATRLRATVGRRVTQQRELMRAELTTVCHLLATYLRTGETPSGALERLGQRVHGVVPGELADAASLIRSGSPGPVVFERLAHESAEPAAARLYRTYGAAWTSGGDPDALLALNSDLRAMRREELARSMTKRQTAMVLPLVGIIGPILILFVAAAIPTMVFGR